MSNERTAGAQSVRDVSQRARWLRVIQASASAGAFFFLFSFCCLQRVRSVRLAFTYAIYFLSHSAIYVQAFRRAACLGCSREDLISGEQTEDRQCSRAVTSEDQLDVMDRQGARSDVILVMAPCSVIIPS